MGDPVLVLRGFGVAFGGRPVLVDIDLDVPRRGLLVLVGPAGSGKSTLLRTLVGLNDAHPSITTWGTAELDGKPACGERARIGLVMQHSRFFMNTVRENLVSALANRSMLDRSAQSDVARRLLRSCGLADLVDQLDREVVALPQSTQRLLAIVRASADDPLLLLADEPTAGLDDDAAIDVVALLRAQAAHRAVLFVTHNQRHAVAAGGEIVLMAGGRIVESGPTVGFFREPKTAPGKRFVETGGCDLPSPASRDEDLDEASPRPPPLSVDARRALERSAPFPRGFFWVVPQRLGGLPRPGIIAELEDDLEGLRGLGVTLLVTLEEAPTVEPRRLSELGIASLHFPVPDMGAPGIPQARELCAYVDEQLAEGAIVAFHCRAGLGRTGTLLASQLVWTGDTALRAIDRVRQINPRCIQSDQQVAFLREFEAAIRPPNPSLPPPYQDTVPIERRRTSNVA